MRYRVTVSDGWEARAIYFADEDEAELVYSMAVNSEMFTYAELSKAGCKYFTVREWSEEENAD